MLHSLTRAPLHMTSGRKLTREEIWKRICETSKDEYVLSEMKRLGFWPTENPQPSVTEAFLEERRKLQARLHELGRQFADVRDPKDAIKQLHQERKQAALERREQTRRKRNSARFERASHWHRQQQQSIAYLGQGLHASLAQKTLDHARLAANSLPLIGSAAELARAMGITLNELRFLCYQREVSTINHYQRFSIPKKTGGERIISAPMPRLKRAQYWLLVNILDKIPATASAQGFVKERNILTNARPHVGQAVVINLDLENFFPSISYARVKGIYKQLGYSEEVATLCALLSTEAPTAAYELDGQRYFVKSGAAALPQGAPTSPALSNLLCRRLDKRLRGAAAKLGFVYSRYADDLTFSAARADNKIIKQLLWRVRKIIDAEGLKVHPKKTEVMRRHQRQEVTGVVVNQRPSVCRKELKKFRALLFQIDQDGPAGKHWREGELFASIHGYANFVAMVNPDKGKPLLQRVAELRRKYRSEARHKPAGTLSPLRFRASAAAGSAPRPNWWQAQPGPPPVLELTQQQRDELEEQQKQALTPTSALAAKSTASTSAAQSSSAPSRPEQPRPASPTTLPWWAWWLILLFIVSLLRRCIP